MTEANAKTLGVLLAGGSGSRFTGTTHKLLAVLAGKTVLEHALASATAADLDHLVVVTGAADLSQVLQGVETVHNPQWHTGQRSSVACALEYAQEHSYDAVVIGLADQPFILTEAWQAVAQSDSPIAVATYDGVRGNPVRLHASVWPLFQALQADSDPDAGARTLMRFHPELVCEVACKGNSADIDTTKDLSPWI